VLLETFGPDGERLGVRSYDDKGNPIDTGATRGFRSARFLDPLVANRFWQSEPKAPPVGTPLRVQVRLYPTDLVIPKGGRVRLTVSGSAMSEGGLESLVEYLTGVQPPSLVEDPSQPSGSATRVTILHDCAHPSTLRFLMPRRDAKLLNVRESDETGPLRSSPPRAPVSDAARLATAPVCGQAPIRLEGFGPELAY
jgi:hypothetical protein